MIHANELMIGDWVQGFVPNSNSTIYGIFNEQRIAIIAEPSKAYIELSIDDIRPIPLTPEILEKNFPTAGELAWWPVEDGLHCESRNTEDIMVSGVFRFVHQLQHALILCGIDKSIEL